MPHQNQDTNEEISLEKLIAMHPDDLRALKFGLLEKLADVRRQREPTLCDQCKRGPQSARPVRAP